jgi:hypothetical protein
VRHRCLAASLTTLLACLILGPAVLADDIVHFQNGTFMKVQGYTLEGDTIKVTLSPGASMSFPKSLVESIERAGRTVYPQASSSPANVVVSGGAGGMVTSSNYIQRGEDQIPARHRARPEGGSGTGDAADKDAAAAHPDRAEYQLPGSHGQLRALGRRSAPIGESLVDKDPTAPPQQVLRPRSFSSLAPKGMPTQPVPPSTETTPTPQPPAAEPPPAEPEAPVEDPPAEDDGGN